MNYAKVIWATLLAVFVLFNSAFASKIEVDDSFDFKLAFDFAFSNNIDTLVLITSGGVYTTTDTVYLQVRHPMTIIAAPGLAQKPIITNSDANGTNLEMIRIHDDFTVEGVIFDGGHPVSHGMKYAMRVGPGPDGFPLPKVGLNVTIRDCDFVNLYQNKDLASDGHGFYFLKDVDAGTVRIEDCTFANTGYEAIRMSETEKYVIDRVVDTLIVRNTTFTNIDAEAIRFYADLDTATEDAYALFENLTVNGSATRMMFVKNNQNTIARNIIVTNSRQSGHGRDDYVMQIQQNGSHISHVDTFNVNSFTSPPTASGRVSGTKGATVDTTTVYGFDPEYANAALMDYTLSSTSPVCNLGHDGGPLGDRRWGGDCPPVGIEEPRPYINDFYLRQNYPNPFNPSTIISYFLPKSADVSLRIYDVRGSLVETIVNSVQAAGEHQFTWNAEGYAAGVYMYTLKVGGDKAETRKMILLK